MVISWSFSMMYYKFSTTQFNLTKITWKYVKISYMMIIKNKSKFPDEYSVASNEF